MQLDEATELNWTVCVCVVIMPIGKSKNDTTVNSLRNLCGCVYKLWAVIVCVCGKQFNKFTLWYEEDTVGKFVAGEEESSSGKLLEERLD